MGKVKEEGWCGLSPISGVGSLRSVIPHLNHSWFKVQRLMEKGGWPCFWRLC